jgi:hypothetical protein
MRATNHATHPTCGEPGAFHRAHVASRSDARANNKRRNQNAGSAGLCLKGNSRGIEAMDRLEPVAFRRTRAASTIPYWAGQRLTPLDPRPRRRRAAATYFSKIMRVTRL